MTENKRYRGRFPASQADRKERERREAMNAISADVVAAYVALFSGKGAKADANIVLRDLIQYCMVARSTMTGNSWTYFNEGKAEVGRYILQMAGKGIDPELIE